MTTIHPEGSIDLEVQDGVLLIGINRPNKRNELYAQDVP